jgi:hypothetical protein
MRNLTDKEIDFALDDNGEKDEGCVAIEASIGELALKETGTSCGHVGNTAFIALGVLFSDNATRLVRGWYDLKDNTLCGMIHIQCEDDDLAERISETAYEIGKGGSLRPSGKSLWSGFYEFENE